MSADGDATDTERRGILGEGWRTALGRANGKRLSPFAQLCYITRCAAAVVAEVCGSRRRYRGKPRTPCPSTSSRRRRSGDEVGFLINERFDQCVQVEGAWHRRRGTTGRGTWNGSSWSTARRPAVYRHGELAAAVAMAPPASSTSAADAVLLRRSALVEPAEPVNRVGNWVPRLCAAVAAFIQEVPWASTLRSPTRPAR